jgi:lipid A disaccharide synthetase
MMHTPYIGLVNILADREAVPEFVDYHDRTTEVADAMLDLLRDGRERKRTISRLRALKEEVAAAGASDRAADAVLALARARRARG